MRGQSRSQGNKGRVSLCQGGGVWALFFLFLCDAQNTTPREVAWELGVTFGFEWRSTIAGSMGVEQMCGSYHAGRNAGRVQIICSEVGGVSLVEDSFYLFRSYISPSQPLDEVF
jgi:hypothetical protein